MKKYCFINLLKPECRQEYMDIHINSPPEILQALRDNGAVEEMIYIYKDMAVVFVKTDDYEGFMKGFGETECGRKWYQTCVHFMSDDEPKCLDENGDFNTDTPLLEKVFDLEQQMAGKLEAF